MTGLDEARFAEALVESRAIRAAGGGLDLFGAPVANRAAETPRKSWREEIMERQARRLVGTAGDMTADMFGAGEMALFSQRWAEVKGGAR
jgi:hypothetical protein